MAIPLDKRSNLSEFRSLSNNYVFYERLKEEENKEILYNSIKTSLGKASEIVLNLSQQYEKIYKMSENELRKEEKILNQVFGANVNIDLSNKDSVKELIDTFNSCLSLKKAYEDNVNLIKNTRGAKSAISFFPTYFSDVWKSKQNEIYEGINKINLNRPQEEVNIEFAQFFESKLQEVLKEAIIKMFKAEPLLKEQTKGEGSYSELLNVIGDFRNKGSFANQIYNIYGLKEIEKILNNQILYQKNPKISIDGVVNKDFNQRGGLALESVENLIFNEVSKKLRKTKNVKVETIHSGSKNVKADNIMTFNLQMGKIEEILDSLTVNSGREKNIEAFNQLSEYLNKVDDSYIIYSSDKNYTYNEGFERRGGFGGESINLESYSKIIKQIDDNFDGFIGAIVQTLKGAIGEDILRKEDLEQTIAQQVAFLLFDDFKTIGVPSGNAIHVFNLNGVYIPLSFLLFLLGKAIEEGLENPKNVVKVDLRTPQILWPQKSRPNDTGIKAWNEQRANALKNTQINMHFLSNFKSLITEYL